MNYGYHVLMLICAPMGVLVPLDAALIIFEPLDCLVHKLIKMYLNASKYEATRCEDGNGRWNIEAMAIWRHICLICRAVTND